MLRKSRAHILNKGREARECSTSEMMQALWRTTTGGEPGNDMQNF